MAIRTIDIPQTLSDKLLTADYATKRNFLEILGSNYRPPNDLRYFYLPLFAFQKNGAGQLKGYPETCISPKV